jgi:sugar phosphate isomerase/epimerase
MLSTSRLFRYAYNLVTYGREPVEASIDRLEHFGYDAVEVAGDPEDDKIRRLRGRLDNSPLSVSSISCLFTPDRDLSSSSPVVRSQAVEYLLRMVEMAALLGAPVINTAPAAVNRTSFESAPEQEWEWAVDGLRRVAEAADGTCSLAIEPWNRYETHLINRLSQAVALARAVGHPAVGVMADVFHMNIEESKPLNALEKALPLLRHIQFADNTRAAPGTGSLDFRGYLGLLQARHYSGCIAFELFPAKASPLKAVLDGDAPEFFDEYTGRSISHLLALESEMVQQAPKVAASQIRDTRPEPKLGNGDD